MYPLAVGCGVPVDVYWDLTFQEIYDAIDAYGRRQKEVIGRLFVLAEVISNRIGYVFTKKEDRNEENLLKPWHFYPTMFEEERTKAEEPDPSDDKELQAYNARMIAWAENWNRRSGKEQSDDTGRIAGEDQG